MGNFYPPLSERLNPSQVRFDRQLSVIMQMLRCALPGIVQSFDQGPPATVSVLVATNEYVQQNTGGATGPLSVKTTPVQLPVLSNVPVQWPQGGGWNVTFPIQAGDECIVVFLDTMLDIWFQNGGLNNIPIDPRRHNLSDGIAIFGVRSTPRGLDNYSTDSMQIRNDDSSVVIDLSDDGVTITAPAITVNATGEVEVNAETVTIAGSSSVTISSNTTIDGRVFLDHAHGGVMSGGSSTGPVE